MSCIYTRVCLKTNPKNYLVNFNLEPENPFIKLDTESNGKKPSRRPAPPFDLYIGFDWGASTSKVSFTLRQGPRKGQASAIPFEGFFTEDASDGYLPSSILLDKGECLKILEPEEAFNEEWLKAYYKANIIRNAKDTTSVIYAIFNVACLLNDSLRVISQRSIKQFNSAIPQNVTIKFGIPSNEKTDALAMRFKRIFTAAVNLLQFPALFNPKDTKKETLHYFYQHKSSELIEENWHIELEPEVVSEIAPFIEMKALSAEYSILIDIGSATLDLAFFEHNESNIYNYLIRHAVVLEYGVDNAISYINEKTGSKLTKEDMFSETENSYLISEYLPEGLKDHIRDFINTSVNIIKKIDGDSDRNATYIINYYILGGGMLSELYCQILEDLISHTERENQYFINKRCTFRRGYLPIDTKFIRELNQDMRDELKPRFMVSRGLTRTTDNVKAIMPVNSTQC